LKRTFFLLAVQALAVGAFAAGATSVYYFDGNLNPTINANNQAQPLVEYDGAGATFTPWLSGTNYISEMVGATTKQVAEIVQGRSFFTKHGLPANGGGTYTNQYTIVLDIKFTRQDWTGFYNTNDNHANDSDVFMRPDQALGISGSYAGFLPLNQWVRFAVSVDLTQPAIARMRIFADGVFQNSPSIGSGVDGRWSLYNFQNSDPFQHLLLFGDNTFAECAAGWVSMAAFYDAPLSDAEIAALGPVGTPIAIPSTVTGTVNLEDWTVDPAGTPIVVEIYDDAGTTLLETRSTLLGTAGAFSVGTSLASGTYDVKVKGPKWLRRLADDVVFTSSGASGVALSLINGDVDNNNAVDSDDFDALVATFGLQAGDPNYDSRADLTGGGLVDSDDFDVLIKNFGLNGQ